MKTYLECLPCFLKQTLKVMELNSIEENKRQVIMKRIMENLANIDLNKTPPEFAKVIYGTITDSLGSKDLYKEIKERDNKHALSLVPEVLELINNSENPLFTAVKIAVAGNIIDFASSQDYNVKKTINHVIENGFIVNDFEMFKKEIEKAKSVAYIADNSGEIVFDKLLIEEIMKKNNCKIDFFVRGFPIINDATKHDAKLIGIEDLENVEIKEIVDGFPNMKNKELIDSLEKYDLIISKGQANYECLSELDANVYFLLITKCPIIAKDLGVEAGKSLIKRQHITKRIE